MATFSLGLTESKIILLHKEAKPVGTAHYHGEKLRELAEKYGKRQWKVESYGEKNWRPIKERSVYLVVQGYTSNLIEDLRNEEHWVIFLVADGFTPAHLASKLSRKGFHAIWYPNRKAMEDFPPPEGVRGDVVYSYCDEIAYSSNQVPPSKLKPVYIGRMAGAAGVHIVPEVVCLWVGIGLQERFLPSLNYNCHFSVRQGPLQDSQYKPMSKLTTAAQCLAPLVTTKEQSSVEILPQDYPYWIEQNQVTEAWAKVKGTFEAKEWYYALSLMKDLQGHYTAARYVHLLEHLVEEIES
jgi:hypothetical protein